MGRASVSLGIQCIAPQGAVEPMTPPPWSFGAKRGAWHGPGPETLPRQAGNAVALWGDRERDKAGEGGLHWIRLAGLESFIIKSPVTLQQKAPHRLEGANKTSTLYNTRPLLTSSFQEEKCTQLCPHLNESIHLSAAMLHTQQSLVSGAKVHLN